MKMRVNIGCGMSPTLGWQNFDSSPSLKLAKLPRWITKYGHGHQWDFVEFLRDKDIRYANAARRIPLANGSVEVLYSSHMMEHLDRAEARVFLREAYRVLSPGGYIRLVLPDLERRI